MAAPGSFENPSSKPCWQTCDACYRCANKNTHAKCANCSGRHDPRGMTEAHPDDWCNCTEGNLRFVTARGKRFLMKYKTNPFGGKAVTETKTQDERDWDMYVDELRERMDDPNYDPLFVVDEGGKYRDTGAGSGFKYLGPEAPR